MSRHVGGHIAIAAILLVVVAMSSLVPSATSAQAPPGVDPWATGLTVADLATDGAGNVYVLDAEGDRVVKLDPGGQRLASWPARGASALTVSPGGELYLLDRHDGRVEVLADGRVTRAWNVLVDPLGWRGGIAVGPEGNVYVAGAGSDLAVFDTVGTPLGSWRADELRDHDRQATGDPGVVVPIDVAVGPEGNVYVADSYLTVSAITPDGRELGSWSRGKLASDDAITGISVGPSGLVMVSTQYGPVDRFTADGAYLGSWGVPDGWEDSEWPGDYAEYGYQEGPLDGPVGATTFAPDGTLFADSRHGIERLPPAGTRIDPENTRLDFAPDAPRFLPGDGSSSTMLNATLRDAADEPVLDGTVAIAWRPTDGAGGGGGWPLRCSPGTDPGSVECPVTASGPLGGRELRLVDVETGTTVAGPVHLEVTRKLVLLAQGFNSALEERFCYWGPIRQGDREDCESERESVLADPGGVYGKLASLGFEADGEFGDPGATILDMSWELLPCGGAECVAEVGHEDGDVTWTAEPYDIGGIRAWESLERQLQVDRYATALAETLKRYDMALADPHDGLGVHATFHLVGHSMGGELVVRTLKAAQTDPYFTDPARRGLMRTVISVDGALNWGTTFLDVPRIGPIPYPDLGAFASVPDKGITHCAGRKGFVYAKPSAAREIENANAVQLAHDLMGTTTIALTNGDDWVVPYDPELVDLPVALLESPLEPESGYVSRLLWGYGKGEAGDPDCGHRNLLREQPGGVYTSDQWDDEGVDPRDYRAGSMYPLGKLLEERIGQAVREVG